MDSKPKATRQAFGEALAELAVSNPKIVALDADLSKSTKTEIFARKFPERFFEMGIAEANMIGTGAGLAMSGFIPFICSFGAFITGRYDQIRMSIAYAGANVKIIGTHAGVGIGDDGHSQMALEDLGLMRALPGMVVFHPCDEIETRCMMKFAVEHQGPVYFRLTRQNLQPVHGADTDWHFGRLDVLRKGEDPVMIFATGSTVYEALQAADEARTKGTDVTVVNVHTLKPFDEKGFVEIAGNCKKIITVEDHYVINGLGSVVAEAMASNGVSAKLVKLGLGGTCGEAFGESGEPVELYEKFGISAHAIAKKI